MPLKLKLSWIGSLNQWRKRHHGETYYLGTGNGKTDMESYRKALAKWDAKNAEIDAAEQKTQADERLNDFSRNMTEYGRFLTSQPNPSGSTAILDPVTPEQIQEAEQEMLRNPDRGMSAAGCLAAQMVKDGKGKTGHPGGKTVGELLDKFLGDQKQRNDRRRFLETNVTNDDELLTGKIAWAHLKEFPDCYTRLDKLEAEADAYWASRR